jgi:hypothetical protein
VHQDEEEKKKKRKIRGEDQLFIFLPWDPGLTILRPSRVVAGKHYPGCEKLFRVL